MAGLLLLAVALGWFALCLAASVFLSKAVPTAVGKFVVVMLATPALVVAPFADEIVGQRRFSSLCKSAEAVSFVGVIPAPPELYTAEGDWRLATYSLAQADEHGRLVRLADSLVRWESGAYVVPPGLIRIGERRTQLYEQSSNRLVASWTSYSFKGGFLRSGFLDSTSECHPKLLRESAYGLYKQLLPYRK